MATVAGDVLESAIGYADRGWRVVPILATTKRPPLKEWQHKATTDADQLIAWWEQWPEANVGVCMGPSSGIIDIECDSEEGEKNLLRVFDGQPPITCTFRSGSGRGVHRLFAFRSDLPARANKAWEGVDFKLGVDDKGSQSVFPPSTHDSGGAYLWLPGLSPDECDVAPLPDCVVAFLWNLCEGDPAAENGAPRKSVEEWDNLLAGSSEGQRHNNLTSVVGKILYEWTNLESADSVRVVYGIVQGINAHNKPPLEEPELKQIFVDLLKSERRKRAESSFENETTPTPEQAIDDKTKSKDFKLIIIETEPPTFELFSNRFSGAPGGCIVLTAEQLISGRCIRLEALKQAHFPLPGSFNKAWERKGGLYEQLVATAERRSASPDRRRTAIVAQRILDELDRAKNANEAGDPDSKGRPTKLSDGSVVFAFNSIWDEIRFSADKVTREEIGSALERASVSDHRPRSGGMRRRIRKADSKAIETLRGMAATGLAGPQSPPL